MPENHNAFYSKAWFYDAAFSFKDINRENSFLISIYRTLNNRSPTSFLDLAAGPGRNAIIFAREMGGKVACVDLSNEMAEYGRFLAEKIISGESSTHPFRYEVADIISFDLHDTYDIAGMFMNSAAYILTDESMISHLRCISRHLNEGGIYVIEMTHPRDDMGHHASTIDEWSITCPPEAFNDSSKLFPNGELFVRWGEIDDPFNPINQIRQVTVTLRFEPSTQKNKGFEIQESCPQRTYFHLEMKSLVERSQVFDWLGAWGDWDTDLIMDNSSKSWRMIVALRKHSL